MDHHRTTRRASGPCLALAIMVACAERSAPPSGSSPHAEPPAEVTLPDSVASLPTSPESLANTSVTAGSPGTESEPPGVPPARQSSIEMLAQLATAQALIVSMLLTPFSKAGSDALPAPGQANEPSPTGWRAPFGASASR